MYIYSFWGRGVRLVQIFLFLNKNEFVKKASVWMICGFLHLKLTIRQMF